MTEQDTKNKQTKSATSSRSRLAGSTLSITDPRHLIAPYQSIPGVILRNPRWKNQEEYRIELVRQYCMELTYRGLAMRRRDIKKLNLIDMRAMAVNEKNGYEVPDILTFVTDEYDDYCIRNPFYSEIPCFEKGAFWINTGRYIYFELNSIDMAEEAFTITLRDYMMMNGYWNPGTYGTVKIYTELDPETEMITNYFAADQEDIHTFAKVYRELDYKTQLGWSKDDILMWEKVVLDYADRTEEKMTRELNTNNVFEMARVFLLYSSMLNYFLSNNRPKKAKNQPKTTSVLVQEKPKDDNNGQEKPGQEPEKASEKPMPEQKSKILRMIGMVAVTSERAPRVPTEKTVRNYKLAAWPVRGHTRTYKSGKVAYVRPSVKRRKAFGGMDVPVPQSVIKVRNNMTQKSDTSGENPSDGKGTS